MLSGRRKKDYAAESAAQAFAAQAEADGFVPVAAAAVNAEGETVEETEDNEAELVAA